MTNASADILRRAGLCGDPKGGGRMSLRARWREWDKRIMGQVIVLHEYRRVFHEIRMMTEANAVLQSGNLFWEVLRVTYAHYVAAAVRRQVKSDGESVSLMRLLRSIRARPKEISRETYRREIYRQGCGTVGDADMAFDRFAGPSGAHVSLDVVGKDVKTLEDAAGRTEEFADRCVAHDDPRGVEPRLKFDEVYSAVDAVLRLAGDYHLLVVGDPYEFLPIPLDWKKLFTIPWIR
jgi:hypothetical protein